MDVWSFRSAEGSTDRTERLQSLFEEMQEMASIGVWEYDPSRDRLQWSNEIYRIHGLDPETAEQPTVEEAIERYHRDSREPIRRAMKRALEEGESYTLDLRIANPDGGVRDVRSHGYVVFEDDEPAFIRGTIQNVTEEKRTERRLRQQNERLDDFVEFIAHDLRNPLSVASAYTGAVYESGTVDDLDRVQSALDRIESLLDDMLTAAHAGQSVTETAPVDVGGLARSAWEHVETIGARLHVDDDIGTVEGEYGRLLRLFENLVRNAVEHGGENVSVTVGALDDEAGFYVADDGPGVPESERTEVFERGYTSREGGTGFGLAIVADIVAAHGWTVKLTESATGGARFDVTVTAEPN